MYITRHTVAVATTTDQDATAYTEHPCNGYVLAMGLSTDTAMAATGWVAVTAELSGLPILTSSGLNAAFGVAPRMECFTTGDVAMCYTTGSTDAPIAALIPVAGERIKLVITDGGNVTTGTFYFYVGG